MRQIEELKPSEQFTLWRYWEAVAYRHFGERRRPDPPNCQIDTFTVFISSVCLWFGGGVLLKLCSVYVDPTLDDLLLFYVNVGWFIILFLNLTAGMVMSDPHKSHTVEQIKLIRKYHQSLAKLGKRFDVDLSMFRYELYDNERVEPTPPPRRPAPPKPIPSRAPSRLVSTNDEVCENPHLIKRKEEIGLPGDVMTPAGLRRLIALEVNGGFPDRLVKQADGKRQELIYMLRATPTIGRQMAVYNFQGAVDDKENE